MIIFNPFWLCHLSLGEKRSTRSWIIFPFFSWFIRALIDTKIHFLWLSFFLFHPVSHILHCTETKNSWCYNDIFRSRRWLGTRWGRLWPSWKSKQVHPEMDERLFLTNYPQKYLLPSGPRVYMAGKFLTPTSTIQQVVYHSAHCKAQNCLWKPFSECRKGWMRVPLPFLGH